MKSVFISILNFNGKKNTLECLDSLRNIDTKNFKLTIIVIDNASTDGSPSVISNLIRSTSSGQISNLKFIQNEKNLGFSGGQNSGIRYALSKGADYVLILNNDTYVDKSFIEELLKISERDNSIGILSPKIYFAPKFEYHKNRYSKDELGKIFWYAGGEMDWRNVIGRNRGVDEVDKGQFDKTGETSLATGCCMLLKKEVFDRVGMFHDKYFLYYEDADLTMRVTPKKERYVDDYPSMNFLMKKNVFTMKKN